MNLPTFYPNNDIWDNFLIRELGYSLFDKTTIIFNLFKIKYINKNKCICYIIDYLKQCISTVFFSN